MREVFWVFRTWAKPGEQGYMKRGFSRPQSENSDSHVISYAFVKDGGCYRAELEEAYHSGGGTDLGGTIRSEIPKEWFSLPYERFLEKVVTLSFAERYGFSAEDLKKCSGLKAFFGFG